MEMLYLKTQLKLERAVKTQVLFQLASESSRGRECGEAAHVSRSLPPSLPPSHPPSSPAARHLVPGQKLSKRPDLWGKESLTSSPGKRSLQL